MPGYRRAKTDKNHTPIVRHLRQCGMKVYHTHMVGSNFPDLVVTGEWRHPGPLEGYTIATLVEIKTDEGELSPGQQEFHAQYQEAQPATGYNGPAIVVRDSIEVLRHYGWVE